jgi:hypothetical protein
VKITLAISATFNALAATIDSNSVRAADLIATAVFSSTVIAPLTPRHVMPFLPLSTVYRLTPGTKKTWSGSLHVFDLFLGSYSTFTLSHTKEPTPLGTAKIKVVIAKPVLRLHDDL